MNILAYISANDLENIYELTYKYGWLMREYEANGWLPDTAYLQFNKMQTGLKKAIVYGLEGMADTYAKWLYQHTREGWIENRLKSNYAISEYPRAKVVTIRGMIRDGVVPDAATAVKTELPYYINLYGDSFLGHLRVDPKDISFNDVYQENPEEVLAEFIDFIEKNYYDVSDLYEELYNVDPEGWANKYVDDIMNNAYNIWISRFTEAKIPGGDSMEKEIEILQAMYEEILEYPNLDLDEQIALFQKGLNMSHHHGGMADHLLMADAGAGTDFLNELSGTAYTPAWDSWLTKVLGHPPGEYKEEKEYY